MAAACAFPSVCKPPVSCVAWAVHARSLVRYVMSVSNHCRGENKLSTNGNAAQPSHRYIEAQPFLQPFACASATCRLAVLGTVTNGDTYARSLLSGLTASNEMEFSVQTILRED